MLKVDTPKIKVISFQMDEINPCNIKYSEKWIFPQPELLSDKSSHSITNQSSRVKNQVTQSQNSVDRPNVNSAHILLGWPEKILSE